jgi:hypothetical protein
MPDEGGETRVAERGQEKERESRGGLEKEAEGDGSETIAA